MLFPAILTDSLAVLAQQLTVASKCSEVAAVQIDIIDGLFADNITVTPADCATQDFGELQVDFHFMTEEPLDYLYEAKEYAKTLPIRTLIAQVERLSSQADFLHDAHAYHWKAGFSLDLFTPLSAIDAESWETLDVVQIMAIEAGFQGKAFHEHAFEMLAKVAQKVAATERPIEIIVDGGVRPEHFLQLEELGATGVAMGSAIWSAPDSSAALDHLVSIL